MKGFVSLNFRRKFCLVIGLGGFAACLFMDSALGVSLASVLILLSFIDEEELSRVR